MSQTPVLPEPTTLTSVARVVADTLREAYGQDPAPVLAAAGLDEAGLHAPRGRSVAAAMQRLWQGAVRMTGDAGFGLRAGEHIRPVTFSVLGVTWMASGTLREALQRLCRYSHVISTQPHQLRLDTDTDPAWLHFEYPAKLLLEPAVIVDALFAAVVTLARMVTRPAFAPAALRLRHGDTTRSGAYQRLFACPVSFGETTDAMAFSAAQLDTILVGHESEVVRTATLEAERYLQGMRLSPLATEVRHLLVQLLPSGDAALEEIARRLDRGVSTVQRQLQDEGLSYRQLLEATRRTLAEGYLADRRLSLGEVTYLLGFADQSSFSRAFSRWYGASPRRYRDGLHAGPAGGR